MKAADITDEQVFAIVDRIEQQERRWTLIWDLERAFPQFPPKVILAKMRQMINKGRIDGCGCGCRGDFTRLELSKTTVFVSITPTYEQTPAAVRVDQCDVQNEADPE